MRVARRSNLSRITSDDDWFSELWMEEQALEQRTTETGDSRLRGPQIANAAPAARQERHEGPFIDNRLSRGTRTRKARERRERP